MKHEEIRGKRIILREQREEDAPFFAYWFSQPRVMFQCGFEKPTDEETERRMISVSHRSDDSVWFTITDLDGNIIGVNVYDNSDETPGLGAKTSDKSFEDQFTGKSALTEFAVSKDSVKYPGDQTVDAVTGATISSRGVVGAVNHALGIYKNICGGES